MEDRICFMTMLRTQLKDVASTVQKLDELGVKVKLSVLLPPDTRDGCQGTSDITLNGYILTVTGKFEETL